MEKDKNIYHCEIKTFNEHIDFNDKLEKALKDYLEKIFNDKDIEIVDWKTVYEDQPFRFRVIVIYKDV